MLAVPPFSLGYPGKNAQSGYYPTEDEESITRDDIAKVSGIMNKKSIGPENTRVRKVLKDGKPVLQLLQASAESDPLNNDNQLADDIFLVRGDHSEELAKICSDLEMAKQYAGNDK